MEGTAYEDFWLFPILKKRSCWAAQLTFLFGQFLIQRKPCGKSPYPVALQLWPMHSNDLLDIEISEPVFLYSSKNKRIPRDRSPTQSATYNLFIPWWIGTEVYLVATFCVVRPSKSMSNKIFSWHCGGQTYNDNIWFELYGPLCWPDMFLLARIYIIICICWPILPVKAEPAGQQIACCSQPFLTAFIWLAQIACKV